MRHNWGSIETLFMEVGYNGISLKEISERFNVPYQSVRRRAAKYEWHNKRYGEWIKKRYRT